MKRMAVLLVLLFGLAGFAFAGQATAGVKVVPGCNVHAAHKLPGSMIFACGDAGVRAHGLGWQTWGGKRVKAFGTIDYKVCRPDCASGRVAHRQGKVTLYHKVRCGRHKYRYARARVHVFRGPTSKWQLLTCP